MSADNPAMGQGTLTALAGQNRTGHSAQSHKPGNFSARAMSAEEAACWYWTVNPTDDAELMVFLLLRWRVDPIAFCIEALRIIPQLYQAQILLDLADAPLEVYQFYGLDPTQPKRQILVPSGHGLGKTRVIAIAIWWHKLTHKFSKNVCTAPTGDQLTGQVWGEVRKLYRRLKKRWPVLAQDWEILTASIMHRNPEFGDWHTIARTARPEKPEGLQGAHALDADDEFGQLAAIFGEEADLAPSGGILVVIEEASGVDDAVREVLEGALSEEGARLLAPGNPTRPDGWFARDMDRTGRYAVHHLDCRLSDRSKTYVLPYRDFGGQVHHLKIRGFVRPSYWENIITECDGDEDADRVRVRVRGLKPRSAFEQCIKTHWIEAAERRDPDAASQAEPAIISLDFGLTSDKHAIAVRKGFTIPDFDEWLPKDTPEEITLDAAERAIEWQERYKAKYIIGDSNGVGRGATEYLTRHFREHPELGVTVIHFNSGAGAHDKKRFYRRRDEMWFGKGRAFFSDPRCSIPPGLKAQLSAPGYHEDTTRRIQVESKKDIKKRLGQPSGNAADAVLQTLMVYVQQQEPEEKNEDEVKLPAVFVAHFKRLQQREGNGHLIR